MTKFGIYLINKPKGITSHDAVDYLRKITGEKTIGHAGTLDPLASGLLIIAIGREFTKKISEFSKLDKEYIAEATLGATSTTYDSEGEITATRHSRPDRESRQENKQKQTLNRAQDDAAVEPRQKEVNKALQSFIGKQEQIPPIFSAKKINGKKAYDLARQGKVVELKPVLVHISKIKLLDYRYPVLKFSVKVSSGTYIRSLVHDLGQVLHTGAYMSNLIRTQIGQWRLDQAKTLFNIKQLNDLNNCKIIL